MTNFNDEFYYVGGPNDGREVEFSMRGHHTIHVPVIEPLTVSMAMRKDPPSPAEVFTYQRATPLRFHDYATLHLWVPEWWTGGGTKLLYEKLMSVVVRGIRTAAQPEITIRGRQVR